MCNLTGMHCFRASAAP